MFPVPPRSREICAHAALEQTAQLLCAGHAILVESIIKALLMKETGAAVVAIARLNLQLYSGVFAEGIIIDVVIEILSCTYSGVDSLLAVGPIEVVVLNC